MGFGSPLHWLLVLLVVVLIFGTKKLRNIGSDLGSAVKGFKDGVKGGAASSATTSDDSPPAQVTVETKKSADPNTVDVEAKNKVCAEVQGCLDASPNDRFRF